MAKKKLSRKSKSKERHMISKKSDCIFNRKEISDSCKIDNSFDPQKFLNSLSYNSYNSISSNDSCNKNSLNWRSNYSYSNKSNNNNIDHSLNNTNNIFYQHSSYKNKLPILLKKNYSN